MWFKPQYHLLPNEKINKFGKCGWCDSKYDTTYILREKEMGLLSMEDPAHDATLTS